MSNARMPQAQNIRSKMFFKAGIGPHSEAKAVSMVADELQRTRPDLYRDRIRTGVPYPELPRQKYDLCLGSPNDWVWALEFTQVGVAEARTIEDRTAKVNVVEESPFEIRTRQVRP